MTKVERISWITLFVIAGLLNIFVVGSIIIHDARQGKHNGLETDGKEKSRIEKEKEKEKERS